MTIEEVFSDLFNKYGDEFNWYMIPSSQANETFVDELKREIGKEHFLYDKRIWAAAKCESNDDVLYITGNGAGNDVYYIFHLTYSSHNVEHFPKYERLADVYAVKGYIERSFFTFLHRQMSLVRSNSIFGSNFRV